MSSKVAFSGISFTSDITDSLIVDIYSHLLFYNVFYILPCYLPLRAFSFKMNFEDLNFEGDPPFLNSRDKLNRSDFPIWCMNPIFRSAYLNRYYEGRIRTE